MWYWIIGIIVYLCIGFCMVTAMSIDIWLTKKWYKRLWMVFGALFLWLPILIIQAVGVLVKLLKGKL